MLYPPIALKSRIWYTIGVVREQEMPVSSPRS